MKNIIIIMLLFLSKVLMANEVKAPFGFNWGQTKDEIKVSGVEFGECALQQKVINVCVAKNPIKPVSFGEKYILRFHKTEGLNSIKLITTEFSDDITGSSGKELFNKIKDSLVKKYGDPTKLFERVGIAIYKENNEFYQCLKYSGCGAWASLWNLKPNGVIVLQLMGISRGAGYISLDYESKEWSRLIDEVKQDIAKDDEDSL